MQALSGDGDGVGGTRGRRIGDAARPFTRGDYGGVGGSV